MNVFEAVKDAPPVIARQADCQTCYMCGSIAPPMPLYVALTLAATLVDERALEAGKLLGSYRRPDGSCPPGRAAQPINPSGCVAAGDGGGARIAPIGRSIFGHLCARVPADERTIDRSMTAIRKLLPSRKSSPPPQYSISAACRSSRTLPHQSLKREG